MIRARDQLVFGIGAEVTVMPRDRDDYILQFQRYAVVSRTVPGEAWLYYVRLNNVTPSREFGPLEEWQLQPGWRDQRGQWRRW
ncbi:hypothetical protein HH310_12650 [Actinoplanes sp. TBRC 11911]|uniref:hypothetical protein n=1 Tax=Actinoplanes sp. TBRC 11911 TaxID=2729386 RepID=UPI00145DDD68|nr:hypothetical protein [Actinoplanes sp. TBRC 11911]NMO52043.1 hypothetical protein [Actinoplanes sp. TBRC 11911]